MKNLTEKRLLTRLSASMMITAASVATAFADTTTGGATAPKDMYDVVRPIVDLLNQMIGPMLLVVGAVGALYCILLGVKYARAEEPQDREKAKAHLKGAIIGFVLIFILIVALNLLLPVLTEWANQYQTII